MKIIAHAENNGLLVQATSGKFYFIWADRVLDDPITSIDIRLQRDGGTTDADKEAAAMLFDKITNGVARWGQGSIDITEWYKLMTTEQRKLLYDKEE